MAAETIIDIAATNANIAPGKGHTRTIDYVYIINKGGGCMLACVVNIQVLGCQSED